MEADSMRNRIYLIGNDDCLRFCEKANHFKTRVELVDDSGRYRVNRRRSL